MGHEEQRRELLRLARAEHAAYPQYSGHFDRHGLVRLCRAIGKAGRVVLRRGQLALAGPCPVGVNLVSVWAPGLVAEFGLDEGDFEWVLPVRPPGVAEPVG